MKQLFNKYIISLMIFYAFWLGGVPFIFSKALPTVCDNISHNSDYNIEITNPKLKLNIIPTAKIKAEKLKITPKNNTDTLIIKNPEIKIRILPLLSGRLHINRISASALNVDIHLKDKVALDKDFFEKLKNTHVKCDMIRLDSFEIQATGAKNITAQHSGKNIFYKKNKKYIKLNIESNVRVQNQISELNVNLFLPRNNDIKKSEVNIGISNFDIQPLGDFLKFYLPQDLIQTEGIINLSANKNHLNGSLEKCKILMQDNAKSMIFPDKLNINSQFDITSKIIHFDSVKIDSENIHTVITGAVSNYLDKPLTDLDLSVTLNPSKAEDIISMLPPIITEEINLHKLKQYKFFGDVIGNFTLKGDCIEPDINGDIFISNGILVKPIPKTKGATIKISLMGKYLNFDVLVPANANEKVYVKGGVELYNVKYADMRIWSTKNVDLQLAEEKVLPLHEILNFIIGPVPIMDIKGSGNIDITVKGNRKNPHVWGTFNANNAETFFNDIPNLVLKNADAELIFNDEKAVFRTKKGFVDGQNISINGICNLYGKFDFNVKTKNQKTAYILEAINTSPMLDDIKNMLPELSIADGILNLNLKVYGAVKNIEDLAFNKNLFSSGEIELLDNTFGFKPTEEMPEIKINRVGGNVNFDGTNANASLNAFIKDSPLSVSGTIKNNIADINIAIPKLNLSDILPEHNQLSKDLSNIYVNVKGGYKGNINKIELNRINFLAKIIGTSKNNKLKLANGEINLANDKLSIKNLNGTFSDTNSSFKVDIIASEFSTMKPHTNGIIELKSFELPILNLFLDYPFVPQEMKTVKFNNGKINLNCRIHNNKVNAYTDLGGVALTYLPLDMPIKIINGSLSMRNNSLKLNKINTLLDNLPFLVDGEIHDVFTKQDFDLYLSTKPKQDFIDKYINKNQIYPVKIKGDVVGWIKFKGIKDNYNLKANICLAKEASIYYLGATVGDIENSIVLDMDAKVLKQNIVRIKDFSYDKVISSLGSRQTRLNMLKAHGGIEIYKDDLAFNDLHIKTQNPTDARIFNIIFRKPNIKQGQFTSDIKFNGKLSNPRLLGTFHIFETNIPFLDTTMKNISFVFKEKSIELSSAGEVLGNDISFNGTLKNKLTPPYYIENAQIRAKVLDLNYIINKLKLSQAENLQTFDSIDSFDLSTLIVKNLKMNADSIRLKNIVADNFEASSSLNEKRILEINNFKFNIANGILRGSALYNLSDSNAKFNLKAKDIDANALTYAIFDLDNQIYGDLTGHMSLSCNGTDFDHCMKTLNGNTIFNVSSGRMPKLGSLEYLLKAGNLVKGGITGISINSVIDIITPLKTGEFSDIYGKINIHQGIADDIEITTKGKDLSLFITGTYNCATSIANMEVLGLLSKKISTMFGPLGNISLNTLFNVIPGIDLTKDTTLVSRINKIPGIEISNKSFRKFIAEIRGNINGDDYVTSFKWIN